MKLSLMLLNPVLPVFMDVGFRPKEKVDPKEYEAILQMAEEGGYDAVDISTTEVELFGVETLKKMLEKYHLVLGSMILFEDFADPSKDPVPHAKEIIDAANALECHTLMLVSPFTDPTIPRDIMRETMMKNFRKIVSYGDTKKVTCCIEDYPSTVLPMSLGDDVAALLEAVPGLKLVFDTANMLVMGEEPLSYHDRFADKIGYYHLKDVIITENEGDRMHDGKGMLAVQTGEGIIPFDEILKKVRKSGYEGWLSVEYAPRGDEWNHHRENVSAAREYLQKRIPLDIGINTMSLTRLLQSDLEGTVRKLSENGCTNLEPMTDWGAKEETIAFFSQFTGPNAGWNPDVMPERLAILKRYGMKVRGMFIFDECIMEQASDLGKHCAEIGVEYVVFSFLHFDGVEDVYGKIRMIKELSKILAPYGVKVLIHNHENDFDRMVDKDGKEKHIVEIFIENTARDELMLEVDVGWVHYAGIDVAEFVSQHIDRIHVLHLKDIHSNYRNMHHDTVSVACGEGVVDFKAILAVIPEKEKQRIRLVLDQDSSLGDILEDQIRSLHYFS